MPLDHEYLIDAYTSFLSWAVREPRMVASFEKETGHKFPAGPDSGLAALIDKATGFDKQIDLKRDAYMLYYVRWATQNYWGPDMAPSFYTEILEEIERVESESEGSHKSAT